MKNIQEGTKSNPFNVIKAAPHKKSNLSEDAAVCRLVDALIKNGVKTFFGIPGGPICPLFEAIRLNPKARLIESRHETNAAFAATAYYKATGEVPAVVVTSGPGITNCITGITSAYLEKTPMLLIAGDVAWQSSGGIMAQDSGPEGINTENLLSPITNAQIRVARAKSAATQGLAALQAAINPISPGPALLIIPIDEGMKPAPKLDVDVRAKVTRKKNSIDPEVISQTAYYLYNAERPLLVLGSGCRGYEKTIEKLVNALQIPFITTPRAKGIVSELNPYSLRNGGIAGSMWARNYTSQGIDVALVLGTDLDDSSIGPTPCIAKDGKLIHVDTNPAVFNRNYPTFFGINASLSSFAKKLEDFVYSNNIVNKEGKNIVDKIKTKSAFDIDVFDKDNTYPIAPHKVIAELQQSVSSDTRFITDIGEHMLFVLHYLTSKEPGDFNIHLNLGSMGSGIAGAIGLALADLDRPVVCICGDGGMQMTGMEILTAVKENLPIIYVVFNDARYNMVYHGMKQIFGESEPYDTVPVNFESWASSMGITAKTVHSRGKIPDLIKSFQKTPGPKLIDVRINKEIRIRGGGRVEALQHMSMSEKATEGLR